MIPFRISICIPMTISSLILHGTGWIRYSLLNRQTCDLIRAVSGIHPRMFVGSTTHSGVTYSYVSHLHCQHHWYRPSHVCRWYDMTHSYVWRAKFIYDSLVWVTWLLSTCRRQEHYPDRFAECVTWLIHVCDMTHPCVWHDSSMCVTWLIHVCDMTHSCVWHDSFICHACICVASHIVSAHGIAPDTFADDATPLPIMWHDSFICHVYLTHSYVSHTKHSCVWHDSWVICDMTHESYATCLIHHMRHAYHDHGKRQRPHLYVMRS